MSTKIILSEDLIARHFTCDLVITGMAAIKATGKQTYFNDQGVNSTVISDMPHATRASGILYFFRVKKTLKVGQLAVEAVKLGLRLTDPHSLAAFNKDNPEFARTHPNGTEWLDADGIACYLAFAGHIVKCDMNDNVLGWGDYLWFAAEEIEDSDLRT